MSKSSSDKKRMSFWVVTYMVKFYAAYRPDHDMPIKKQELYKYNFSSHAYTASEARFYCKRWFKSFKRPKPLLVRHVSTVKKTI